jgi:hypothetical protein
MENIQCRTELTNSINELNILKDQDLITKISIPKLEEEIG